MNIDFHVHTQYSRDCILPIEVLKKMSIKKGITPIITDHDTITGNLKFGCKIIGEEIRTLQGEIIGLFLMESIPRGLDLHEAVDRVREQDGLVYIPHPFDGYRTRTALMHEVGNIKADVIEVFNGRSFKDEFNKKALEYAEKNNLPKAVGSDTHTRFEFGRSYAIMDDFYSKKEFLKNLKKAQIVSNKGPSWAYFATAVVKKLKKNGLL